MDSRYLGRSGLQVSRLALGTMTWGRDTDADAAAAQLEAFVEAEGTLIDTANVFGDGQAESMLGTLVPSVVARSSVVLSTTTVGAGGGRGPLLAALDASLGRLGTDHVDLWQVHGFDSAVPFEETCSALTLAVSSGRCRYVGVSGMTGWQAASVAASLKASSGVLAGSSPLVSAQAEYSLLDRSTEDALSPALAAHGLGFLAWAPLGRGVLTGKYRHGTPSDSRGASPHFTRYVSRYRTEQAARVVEAVATAAEGLGTTPLAVACAWVLGRPSVTSVVVGARDRAQLIGSLGAEQVVLPAEIRSALDDVSGA